jgi:hypothetical protein
MASVRSLSCCDMLWSRGRRIQGRGWPSMKWCSTHLLLSQLHTYSIWWTWWAGPPGAASQRDAVRIFYFLNCIRIVFDELGELGHQVPHLSDCGGANFNTAISPLTMMSRCHASGWSWGFGDFLDLDLSQQINLLLLLNSIYQHHPLILSIGKDYEVKDGFDAVKGRSIVAK